MNKTQQQVMEFHQTFDVAIGSFPLVPDADTQALRIALIEEELDELKAAFAADDVVETADALGDILYVVYGAALACGIDMEPVMDEIHRSNMSKVGGHKAENGKWIKPDTYSPANLRPVIRSVVIPTEPPLTRDRLAQMTPDEINELEWAEVRKALSR